MITVANLGDQPMSVLQIMMMLHYYAYVGPYSADNANWGAVRDQRRQLLEWDMLNTVNEGQDKPLRYRVTARGEAYIEFLKALPLPEQKWVLPPAQRD
jgi:hypothetical protein